MSSSEKHALQEARETGTLSQTDRDEYVLAKLGKRQVLKRRFNQLSLTGLATATMISWEGVLCDLSLGLAKYLSEGSFLHVNDMNGSAVWAVTRTPEGREYYYNQETKKTQWVKPDELLTPAQLATGWTET